MRCQRRGLPSHGLVKHTNGQLSEETLRRTKIVLVAERFSPTTTTSAVWLAAADTSLGEDTLDAIDHVFVPGLDLAPEEKIDTSPSLLDPTLRRRR
jgi:hypothetical protein